MKIFFVDANKSGITNVLDMGATNVLVSYWYETYGKKHSLIDHVLEKNPNANIMLDSGAFSAWTQNKEIDLDSYIEFCLANQHRLYSIVNLDVIGNAEQSLENFKTMKKAGLDVIPVFHRVAGVMDPIEHLKYYCKHSDYVALSGYAQAKLQNSVRPMVNYTKKMFEIIPKDKKIHLLGCTNGALIMAVGSERVESVDSSAINLRAVYNRSIRYSGMQSTAKGMQYKITKDQMNNLQRYAVHQLMQMERQINEHTEMIRCQKK